MNAKEMAARLNGGERRHETSEEDDRLAKESGLLIAYGASDDLLELRGVIDDEVGAFDGNEIVIDIENLEIMPEPGDDGFCEKCRARAKIIGIKAEWCPEDLKAPWRITAEEISFEPFDIFEDGELFCRGCVIELKAGKN